MGNELPIIEWITVDCPHFSAMARPTRRRAFGPTGDCGILAELAAGNATVVQDVDCSVCRSQWLGDVPPIAAEPTPRLQQILIDKRPSEAKR